MGTLALVALAAIVVFVSGMAFAVVTMAMLEARGNEIGMQSGHDHAHD